ncbi:type I phosphomannose isomerase catalytic subunit [Silvibacterium sp.]|uniref:type I phosphomannose isomerase catalytic subunit n=1 Tax=Silvibacterium sp. TaxID=1964179 RepID=UPI0039E4C52F
MNELVPFRLEPYFRTRIWGFNDLSPWYDFQTDGEPIGEVWLTGEMCKAATGPHTGLSLTEITAKLGRGLLGESFGTGEFPLLIKLLFPKEKLSVQVHPDDALAQKYGEPRGKTECWYALDAKPGAAVALGIKHGVTADQIRASIENATLEDLLQMVPVSKGDMLYVDAGTVHAMGPGVVILETQQTSDRTYRLYDYGRPRELHIEKSIEAMRLETHAGKIAPQSANGSTILIDEKYFRIERWDVVAGDASGLVTPTGKVQMLFVVDGEIEIAAAGAETFTVGRCQLAVIPADAASVSVTAPAAASVVRIRPNEV